MNVLAEALDAAAVDRPPHEALGMSRRQFLKVTAIALAAGAIGIGADCEQAIEELLEQIRNRPVRKDISTLQPNDPVLVAYKSAITQMQALPDSDRRNWTRQARIHNEVCRHASWLFFPWHRAYLLYFEQICRQLSGDASFALPYWNWTANPQIPGVFFEAGSPLNHSPRTATASSTPNPGNVGSTTIESILSDPNFLSFAGPAVARDSTAQFGPGYGRAEQTPHNHIHGFVGGTMATFMSPLDPIFWTHHNRIEQLWVEWNITRGNSNTNDSDWTGTSFNGDFCDKDGNNVNVTVSELLLAPLLTYRFDTQGA